MFWIFIGLLICLLYYLGTKSFNHWKDKGVPGPKPLFLVGNIGATLMGKKSLTDLLLEIYRKYEGYSFVGFYRMGNPTLMIREPEFLKNILVKDFKHFQNNELQLDKEIDKVGGRHLFFMRGEEWRLLRTKLTNCFTSGKIKAMFPILEEVSNKMVKYVGENCSVPLESGELCVRYTLDNVGVCAFGVDGKCFVEEQSEFRKLASDFLSPGTLTSIKFFFAMLFPNWLKFLKLRLISEDVEIRLTQLVRNVLRNRRENNIKRNDFLEYVSEIFTEDIDIVGQAATFFADGYETSSRVMSFVLFELAKNPNIQQKLREEVNSVCSKNGNQITSDAIQEMTYLDACFKESMRMYPIAGQLFKVCTETYTYTPTDPDYKKISVTLNPGDTIAFSLNGLFKDPKYFENPEEYIPERFLESEINRFAFLPFGEGPRACIGSRFAQTQVKLGLVQLIRNFKMTVSDKTKMPLKFDPWYAMIQAIGGLWINFEKI